RAAVVSGLLGAAGLVAVATPAMAQDNGSTNGSGTTNGSTNGSGNGSDLGTTTTGGTATTGGATTSPITGATSGVLPHTGGTAAARRSPVSSSTTSTPAWSPRSPRPPTGCTMRTTSPRGAPSSRP